MTETKRERYIRILSGLGGADISANACKELVELLKEQPNWIPCSERLPVEGNNVLLSDDLNVTIGRLIHYADIGHRWEIDHWDYDLEDWQAWMPLPEPARLEKGI